MVAVVVISLALGQQVGEGIDRVQAIFQIRSLFARDAF